MKKLIASFVLLFAITLSSTNIVSADEVSKEQSDVGVNFIDEDGGSSIGTGPFANNLSLVWKPTTFKFGNQKAVAGITKYNDIASGNKYLVVSDDRTPDKANQWSLKAQMSKLSAGGSDANDTLSAKLTFDVGNVQKYNMGEINADTNDYSPKLPGSTDTLSPLGTSDPKITLGGTTGSITLEAGQDTAVSIMSKGKTADEAANPDAKLAVAALIENSKLVVSDSSNSAGKSYTGTVTWTLDNLVTQ